MKSSTDAVLTKHTAGSEVRTLLQTILEAFRLPRSQPERLALQVMGATAGHGYPVLGLQTALAQEERDRVLESSLVAQNLRGMGRFVWGSNE